MNTAGGVLARRLAADTRTRALFLWAGLRFGLFATQPFLGVPATGLATFLWVEAIAIALVQWDLRVCRETVLLANLGVSRLQLFRITLPAVLLPETLVQSTLLLMLP